MPGVGGFGPHYGRREALLTWGPVPASATAVVNSDRKRSGRVTSVPTAGEEMRAAPRIPASASDCRFPACDSTYRRHQILPQVVVDHVAAVLVEELDPLFRTCRLHECISREPLGRRPRIDLPIQVAPGRLVAGVAQPCTSPSTWVYWSACAGSIPAQRVELFSLEARRSSG